MKLPLSDRLQSPVTPNGTKRYKMNESNIDINLAQSSCVDRIDHKSGKLMLTGNVDGLHQMWLYIMSRFSHSHTLTD